MINEKLASKSKAKFNSSKDRKLFKKLLINKDQLDVDVVFRHDYYFVSSSLDQNDLKDDLELEEHFDSLKHNAFEFSLFVRFNLYEIIIDKLTRLNSFNDMSSSNTLIRFLMYQLLGSNFA